MYKLYSNYEEIDANLHWMSAAGMQHQVAGIVQQLQQFNHDFYSEGEGKFLINLKQKREAALLEGLPAHYKEGTLLVHGGAVGFVSYTAGKDPTFLPALDEKKDIDFYRQYVAVRDGYIYLLDSLPMKVCAPV